MEERAVKVVLAHFNHSVAWSGCLVQTDYWLFHSREHALYVLDPLMGSGYECVHRCNRRCGHIMRRSLGMRCET